MLLPNLIHVYLNAGASNDTPCSLFLHPRAHFALSPTCGFKIEIFSSFLMSSFLVVLLLQSLLQFICFTVFIVHVKDCQNYAQC